MSQTVIENSTLSPNLGWVHQVHTLPSLRAQYAHTAPCRSPGLTVSQAWPGRVASLGGRIAACTRAPLRAPCAVSQCSPWPCRFCIATQPAAKPLPPCHDKIDCIVTRLQRDCPLVMIQRLYRDTPTQRPIHAPVAIQTIVS